MSVWKDLRTSAEDSALTNAEMQAKRWQEGGHTFSEKLMTMGGGLGVSGILGLAMLGVAKSSQHLVASISRPPSFFEASMANLATAMDSLGTIPLSGGDHVLTASIVAIGAAAGGVALAGMSKALGERFDKFMGSAHAHSFNGDDNAKAVTLGDWLTAAKSVVSKSLVRHFGGNQKEKNQDIEPGPVQHARVEASLVQAQQLADLNFKETVGANLNQGRYTGVISHTTPFHVVQSVGMGRAVIHEKALLNAEATIADMVQIRYQDGRGNVAVRTQGREKGRDQGR